MTDNYNKFLEKLKESWALNPDKPEETPESTLRALYFVAAGNPFSVRKALTMPPPELDQDGLEILSSLVEKRCAGVPLAHITERQQFMGIEMLAGPQALIPRVETELLGYEVLDLSCSLLKKQSSVTLIDVCSGSGNIVLGVSYYQPQVNPFGSDLSIDAINLAKQNAKFIGLENKVVFKTGDLFEAFNSKEFYRNVDIISCNPPYISSKKVLTMAREISHFEPLSAFDGGPFGFNILSRVIREAPVYLKSNSFLCLEVGLGQGEFVTQLFIKSNLYNDVLPVVNASSEVRALIARAK